MSIADTDRENITRSSNDALAALSALVKSHEVFSHDQQQDSKAERLQDEIDRLRIWAHEHDVTSGGLDGKLADATVLRDRVILLLTELSGVTDESIRLDSDVDNFSRAALGRYSLRSSSPDDESAPSIVSATTSLDTNVTLPESLPDTPLRRIHEIISLLFVLGPTLLNPAPQARLEEVACVSENAAQYDIGHVRARFPHASENLVERLGRANWELRKRLITVRSTLEKQYSDEPPEFKPASMGTVGPPNRTFASDASQDSESGQSDPRDSNSDDARFPTSRSAISSLQDENTGQASQVMTAPTTITITINDDTSMPAKETPMGLPPIEGQYETLVPEYGIPLPPPPNADFTGVEFVCPFCARKISGMQVRSEWKKHILNDLKPYLCTFDDCTIASKTYGSKWSWWRHENDSHRTQRSWVCNPCEREGYNSAFETQTLFATHLSNHHPVKLTSMQVMNISRMCRKDIGRRHPNRRCPLCRDFIVKSPDESTKARERAARRHVSEHLEQLAFFVASSAGHALLGQDNSVFQDDSDSEIDHQIDLKSVVSRDTHWSRKEIQSANVEAFIADQESVMGDAPGAATQDAETSKAVTHEEAPDQTTGTPQFPIIVQLPQPNEHFYSRSNLLRDVDQILNSPGRICILHGVGGVGKTLAAVHYSHKHKAKYDAIFWLQADTAPGLTDSFSRMATSVGVCYSSEPHHLVVSKGRQWLQETDKRWLLIFDNATRWDDLTRYLPNAFNKTNGSILITTQHEKLLPQYSHVKKVRIEPLDQDQGAKMLLRYLGRDKHDDPESDLAKEISVFVGGLPVAIAHVAGYVGYSEYSLEELIETFREWRKSTGVATDEADDLPATFREASFSYEGTLAMVREVTLRELTEDARNVLNIIAFLNCASVPLNMLWGMHEDPSLSFLDRQQKIRMRRTNDSIVKRRLVAKSDGCFVMHRSLQRGICDKLSRETGQQQQVFDWAVALVREVFPQGNELQQPTPDKWAECQKLLPHLHALHEVYHRSESQIKGSTEFAQLLIDAGMDQFEQGIQYEGLTLLYTAEKALDTCSGPSAEDHPVMKASIHALIAIMYDDIGIGKRQEALQRREIALNIRKQTYERSANKRRNDEILVFNSWMEYAISLLHYHRFAEAEPIIENCLVKFREWDTEDKIPFEYAKYYNKIALVRMYQGRFEEAIRSATKSVDLMIKAGYDVFMTRFKFDLACITLQSGDLDRALQIHEDIHQQRIEIVGPANQLSLHSMFAMGAICELKGQLFEAENWFQKVLDQGRSVASWPEEALSRTQFHLSKVLMAQGRPEDTDKADGLRESAMASLNRLLPLDHPQELASVTDEAILFDHLLPISPGGPRFTGRGLLECFMRR